MTTPQSISPTAAQFMANVSNFLPPEISAVAERLLASPEFGAVLARGDAELLVQRQALRSEIDSLHDRTNDEMSSRQQALREAAERQGRAKAEYDDAQQQLSAAQGAVHGYQVYLANIRSKAEAELRRTSDGRLTTLENIVIDLEGHVRNALYTTPWHEGRTISGAKITRYDTNHPEVTAASKELVAVRKEIDALRLSALSVEEMTDRLRGECKKVCAAVARVNFQGPWVDDEAGTIVFEGRHRRTDGSETKPDAQGDAKPAEQGAAKRARSSNPLHSLLTGKK